MREYINIVEGISDAWFKDGSFEAFKIPDKREPFRVATDDGVINTLENPVPYKKGDYIVTGPDGEEYPIGPETFNKLKSDNGDGRDAQWAFDEECRVLNDAQEVLRTGKGW